ncbi:MAG: hypothetical protein ABEJ81_04825 [Haloferacaceae archaeon]
MPTSKTTRFGGAALLAILTALVMRQYPVPWLPGWYWFPAMGVLFLLYLDAYRIVSEYREGGRGDP